MDRRTDGIKISKIFTSLHPGSEFENPNGSGVFLYYILRYYPLKIKSKNTKTIKFYK